MAVAFFFYGPGITFLLHIENKGGIGEDDDSHCCVPSAHPHSNCHCRHCRLYEAARSGDGSGDGNGNGGLNSPLNC